MIMTSPLTKLIDQFRTLPGIGAKTATRLAFHVLRLPTEQVSELAKAIVDAKQKTKYCSICFNFTEQSPCEICQSEGRDKSKICVIAQPQDIIAMERTRIYRGLYHVLHGLLSPLDGIGPEDIKIKDLLYRAASGVDEIIIATNSTVEGEATAMYISRLLKPIVGKVSRIAHGLPVGGDIEYADEVTLAKALENRREL